MSAQLKEPKTLVRWVDHDKVELVWPHVEDLLVPAFQYCDGKWLPEDALQMLKENRALLWFGGREDEVLAAGVTWVDLYPQARRLVLAFAGGDKTVLRSIYPYVEDYARFAECDGIEIWGREGWVREFRDLGFKRVSTTVRKQL